MDLVPGKTLQFDRFTLDLARGALRFDDREVFPRPKVFEVLCHLAGNGRRLIAKQELFAAVWRGLEVTDDSLVQCIRELRWLLGDKEHRLIRTVMRRGYLLDAEVRSLESGAATVPTGSEVEDSPATGTYAFSHEFRPAPLPRSALNSLFSKADNRRVVEIARRKMLPLPRIEMDTPDDDVPAPIRRFVGIWVSTKGFVGTSRQFMLVVTHVEKEGLAGGYTVRGPPTPNSRIQNPAEAVTFTAYINGKELTYDNPRGHYRVWFARQGSLVFEQTYRTGHTTMVALAPVWTLRDAERTAARRLAKIVRPGRVVRRHRAISKTL